MHTCAQAGYFCLSLCLCLFILFCSHTVMQHIFRTHSWTCFPTIFPHLEYILVWHTSKAQVSLLPREDCLKAPCWMLWNHSVVWGCTTLPLQRYVHTHIVHCWLHCQLPGGRKLIIHTLCHQRSHTYCNPGIYASCSVNSCKCLLEC